MIDGLVGVFVMVGVTTFMAALVELGSFVLAPPASVEAQATHRANPRTTGHNQPL